MHAATKILTCPLFTLCSDNGIVNRNNQANWRADSEPGKTARANQASAPNSAAALQSRQSTPPTPSGKSANGDISTANPGAYRNPSGASGGRCGSYSSTLFHQNSDDTL